MGCFVPGCLSGSLLVASHLVHHPELIAELSQKVSQSCLKNLGKNCGRIISKICDTKFVLSASCLVPVSSIFSSNKSKTRVHRTAGFLTSALDSLLPLQHRFESR